jgi:lipopolysaccharide/colanic/teichoic acid biosynthesis glycosyltransferase
MNKRAFDLLVAVVGLIVFSPILLLVAVLIKLDSRGPVFFRQERIGYGFRPFLIWKFRTMVQDAAGKGGLITVGQDSRITRIGRVLRKTKLDELPQLINVLKGEMSLVGPRPEVRRYVQLFRQDYEEILQVLPGITDPASLHYRNEAEVLGQMSDPELAYIAHLLPEKIRLAKEYRKQASLRTDLTVIAKTLVSIWGLDRRK